MKKNEIVITEIQIVPIKPQDGLIGFASFVLNGCLYLGSIGIHTRLDGSGFRLTYPTKGAINIFHPINKEVSKAIEEAVFAKAEEVMNFNDTRNDRHREADFIQR
ncbi:septation protein SpoVG family protein [Candidatus Peregrinibacteria bacterium]|nr:septation protein SpoVG family protein [Candidatus Peregrinibacteria bacterium]